MRKSGFSFDDIAARIGVSASNGGKLFRRAMASVPVPSAQEFLLMHNERLEHIYSIAVREANKGNVQAIGKATDIQKQMADLEHFTFTRNHSTRCFCTIKKNKNLVRITDMHEDFCSFYCHKITRTK